MFPSNLVIEHKRKKQRGGQSSRCLLVYNREIREVTRSLGDAARFDKIQMLCLVVFPPHLHPSSLRIHTP